MSATVIAVDVAKSVFEVAVSTHPGRVAERHRLTRSQFARFVATQPPATLLMEACGTAHFWGRCAQTHGHHVVLLPPQAVRPYVPRNKTDRADAKGLLEAARNESLPPVPVKSEAQQALTALHRLRSTWLAARTARLNTVRGVLCEFGVAIPLGACRVRPAVAALLADGDATIPVVLRPTLQSALDEIGDLERRLHDVEHQIAALAAVTPAVAALRTIPGVGLLTATALVAFVGNATRFPTARHFASYLGLTPRERSSGSWSNYLCCGSASGAGDGMAALRAGITGLVQSRSAGLPPPRPQLMRAICASGLVGPMCGRGRGSTRYVGHRGRRFGARCSARARRPLGTWAGVPPRLHCRCPSARAASGRESVRRGLPGAR